MLRVATLNLRGNANRWDERFPLVVDVLRQANADVIGLQEVRLKINQHQLIADALNTTQETCYQAFLCEDWYEPHILANAFLVRVPVSDHQRIELPEGYRTAQRVTVDINGQKTTIINTHLHHKPYRDEVIRLQQLDCILNWIDSVGQPAVLMGDLNANPDSETMIRAKERFQSAYEVIHTTEPNVTFPTPLRAEEKLTPRTIDYILCDPIFTVNSCELIATSPANDDASLYASDHFGLVTEIS